MFQPSPYMTMEQFFLKPETAKQNISHSIIEYFLTNHDNLYQIKYKSCQDEFEKKPHFNKNLLLFCNIIALYQLMLKRPKLKHQAPVHCDLEQSLKSLPFYLVKDKDNILNSILCWICTLHFICFIMMDNTREEWFTLRLS